MEKYVGVDVGGTNLKFGIFLSDGQLIKKWSIVTDYSDHGIHMWKQICEEINKNIERKDLRGIGIGIPGPVLENGFVEVCVNLDLHNFDPASVLKEYFPDVEIAVVNDANAAALGEQWKGSGQGYRSIGMVTLGTGVGGAIIIDGKLCCGANGLSGEIGHIRVNSEEKEKCTCGGIGCVDQIASATGIVRYAKKLLMENDAESSLRMKEELTAEDVINAAKAGDNVAEHIIKHCMKYLAKALAAAAYIADPEVFIIGGGVSNAGQYLIDIIQESFNTYITLSKKKALIIKASLGNDAGIYGAAKTVIG